MRLLSTVPHTHNCITVWYASRKLSRGLEIRTRRSILRWIHQVWYAPSTCFHTKVSLAVNRGSLHQWKENKRSFERLSCRRSRYGSQLNVREFPQIGKYEGTKEIFAATIPSDGWGCNTIICPDGLSVGFRYPIPGSSPAAPAALQIHPASSMA